MKDKYVGDIGDFCKYGLLNALFARSNLRLGINWYYTPNDESPDGKFIDLPPNLQDCMPGLDDKLTDIRNNNRALGNIEHSGILPQESIFYRDPLGENTAFRERWHSAALDQLKTADIVFLDPDNGIATEKMEARSKRTNKSVFSNEIEDYYRNGKSVIVYNHCSRENQVEYTARFERVYRLIPDCYYRRIRTHRGTARDYCFFIQPFHREAIELALNELLSDDSVWKRYKHFSEPGGVVACYNWEVEHAGKPLNLKVVVTKGEDGYYLVEVPSLVSCFTQGKTKEEALENIKEVIELSLEHSSNASG